MLRRIEDSEEEYSDPTTAAIDRAKTLHARSHAFTEGQLARLLAKDRTPTEDAEHKEAETPGLRT